MSGSLRILSAFILFASIFITPSFAGEVSLPRTTDNPVSYAPGDDGDIQAGVAWPTSRFTNNQDGTLTDNLTGLMWMGDADCVYDSGYTKVFDNVTSKPLQSWSQAFDFVGQLNEGAFNNMSGYTARYTDWRVPNINEMESLVRSDSSQYTWLNYYKYFVNFQNTYYTSSTTVAGDPSYVWVINMICGKLVQVPKNDSVCYMVPVRGVSNGQAQVWQTGQTATYRGTSYDDDGARRTGVEWDPVTRFIDNTDGTVTDTLTSLMWLKDATKSGSLTWADALTYVANLNSNSYLGYTDWRLPNRKELRSLLDYSQAGIPLPAGYPFKVNSYEYWTSSRDNVHSNPTVGNAFWFVAMNSGDSWFSGTETFEPELGTYQVWPVRGGVTNGQVPSKYTLTVSKTGDGTGQVTSNPSGINCGASCATEQASFNANDQVVLTANPSSGSIFVGWSGGATGSSSTVKITMTSGKSVTASFGKSSYSLTTSENPAAGGSVALSAPGPYAPNSQVTLTPHPARGYAFSEWSGDASGTQNPLAVTMNKDMTITANFTELPDTLALGYTQSGKAVTLNASLEMDGDMMPGQQVQIFQTTLSGKDVSCGKATTGPDGTCRKKFAVNPGVTRTWYAKVVSKGICEGMESPPVSCTIGRVTSISPDNKTVVTVPDPYLSWQGYDNATGYEVQVSTGPGFPAAYTTTYPAAGTTFNGETLSMGKKYFWRVIAELPTGTSMPSAARKIVYKEATNLSLTLTSVDGNKGTFQATLTDSNGIGIPGRAVRITGGKRAVAGKTLADGSAVKTVPLPQGSYSIKATFGGNASYAPSQSLPVLGP
jgi:Protein of unknown function (DUF1566)/Divergent InlB B-repeat domain/Bacterial Ig-like domain (group 3)